MIDSTNSATILQRTLPTSKQPLAANRTSKAAKGDNSDKRYCAKERRPPQRQVMAIPTTNAGASCATSGKSAPPRRVAAITPSTKIAVAASMPQAARPRLPRRTEASLPRQRPATTPPWPTFGLATSDNAASSIALAPGIAPNANTFQPVKSSELRAVPGQNAETTANAVAAKACFTFRKIPREQRAPRARSRTRPPEQPLCPHSRTHDVVRHRAQATLRQQVRARAPKTATPESASATTSAPTANAAPALATRAPPQRQRPPRPKTPAPCARQSSCTRECSQPPRTRQTRIRQPPINARSALSCAVLCGQSCSSPHATRRARQEVAGRRAALFVAIGAIVARLAHQHRKLTRASPRVTHMRQHSVGEQLDRIESVVAIDCKRTKQRRRRPPRSNRRAP